MLRYLENNKVKLVYLPLVIYWIILLTATSLPSKDLPSIGLSDKVEHVSAFFVLAVLFNLTLLFQNKYSFLKKNAPVITLVLLSFYALLDELHQLFIPGRSCDVLDWIADFTGISLGVLLILFIIIKEKYSRV